jgi:RND family efflux transporter MFP subunit
VHVGYEGAQVAQGDALFELYSPDLYAAQQEYLLALRGGQERLLEAARTKLAFFDITDEQIAALRDAGEPSKTMTVRSPHSGIVIDKHANEGMNVNPGMRVYRIADLSRVWVMATLYEYQLPYVEQGQTAVMSLPYIPGQTFEGRVAYVYPYLNERTREVKVRLEFDNPHGTLKPGMFANIQLQSRLRREATLVPSEAVIDTGERAVAFVSLGDGKFEPRDVTVGVETEDGKLEVLTGIKPGEMVVTSGQFLIDSESRFREALAQMIRGDLASEQEAVVAVEGKAQLDALPDDLAAALGDALDAYLAIQNDLANDSLQGVAQSAQTLWQAMDRAVNVAIPDHEHFWHEHNEAATVLGQAQDLAASQDIAAARETFGRISIAMRSLLSDTGIPPSYPNEVHALRCPMFRVDQGGAYWLQTAGDVRNPYMGQRMLECYDARSAMPVTGGGKP